MIVLLDNQTRNVNCLRNLLENCYLRQNRIAETPCNPPPLSHPSRADPRRRRREREREGRGGSDTMGRGQQRSRRGRRRRRQHRHYSVTPHTIRVQFTPDNVTPFASVRFMWRECRVGELHIFRLKSHKPICAECRGATACGLHLRCVVPMTC